MVWLLKATCKGAHPTVGAKTKDAIGAVITRMVELAPAEQPKEVVAV